VGGTIHVLFERTTSSACRRLPQMQFFKGKSYRGFCPIGPWLTVPEPDEFAGLDDLELLLTVYDAVRQRDSTRNLVFKSAETISELSTFANIAPGDALLGSSWNLPERAR